MVYQEYAVALIVEHTPIRKESILYKANKVERLCIKEQLDMPK